MENRLNMRKKAQEFYEVDPEKMFPTFEKEQTINTITRWLQSEFSSDEIQNLIIEHKLRDYIYYTLVGMYSHLVDKNKLSKNVLKQLAREMAHEWEVEGSPLSIPTDIKELTKIDPTLQKFLQRYTEDEIFDIAAGRKDATEEEVEQAKDVITRGIISSRLSMRKKAQNTLSLQELIKFYELEMQGLLTDEIVDDTLSKLVYGMQKVKNKASKARSPKNWPYEERIEDIAKEFIPHMEWGIDILEKAATKLLNEKIIAIDQVISLLHKSNLASSFGSVFQGSVDKGWETLEYIFLQLGPEGLKEDVDEEDEAEQMARTVESDKQNISFLFTALKLNMRKFSRSSPEIIQKAQAGDENAIAQVIEENTGLISQALINWGYAPKSDEFQDTMSDIKVEMLNRIIPQYDSSKGAFSTFLSTAVYNFLRRGTREKEYKEKQKEVSLAEPVEEGITIEDTLEDKTSEVVQMTLSSARENLQIWLHTKKPELEEVVLRVFDLKVEEYTHGQIAEALNQERYTSKGKPFTRTMVNNYVNDWIKPALAQFFEAFKTAKLNMRKKAQKYDKPQRKLSDKELLQKYKDKEKFTEERAVEYLRDHGMIVTPISPGKYFWIPDPLNPEDSETISTKRLRDFATEDWYELYWELTHPEESEEVLQKFKEEFKTKPLKKELVEETMEASPYAELLRKYTEDEIWDIARGKKDTTEEEIQMATEVITRGIVSNRLSMRKKADTVPLSYKKVIDLVMIVKDLQQMGDLVMDVDDVGELEENLYNVFGNDIVFNKILEKAFTSKEDVTTNTIIKIIGEYLTTLDKSDLELGSSAREILESLIKVCQDPFALEHRIKKVPLKEVFKTEEEKEEVEEWKEESKKPLKERIREEMVIPSKEPISKTPYTEVVEKYTPEILRKYTEDEIFDIASGRKEATPEEVEQAKDVIQRGIVSSRLSMRKKVAGVNLLVVDNALAELKASKIDTESDVNIRTFLAYKEYDRDIIEYVVTKVFGEEEKEERQGRKEINE